MAEQKSAGEILEAVVEDGQEELSRASTGLAISGFAAGLNISFGRWLWGWWGRRPAVRWGSRRRCSTP